MSRPFALTAATTGAVCVFSAAIIVTPFYWEWEPAEHAKLSDQILRRYNDLCPCSMESCRCAAVRKALRTDGVVTLPRVKAGSKIHQLHGECRRSQKNTPPPPRLLYVILSNPFAGERCCYSKSASPRGHIPEASMLSLHLDALSTLPSHVAEINILVPYDTKRRPIPGYLDIAASGARLPCPLRLVLLRNNTLGSHGAYLHTYARHRADYQESNTQQQQHPFQYYVFAEEDYLPLIPHWDARLHRMYVSAFGSASAVGCLAGLMQGRPVEPRSRYPQHTESSHVMSAAALEAVYRYAFGTRQWAGPMTTLMLKLCEDIKGDQTFGLLQACFGILLTEAGVSMRDWSAVYRVPYWNHYSLVDWSGPMHAFAVPPEQVLIAPTQYLFHSTVKQCCLGSDCDEADRTKFCMTSRKASEATSLDACCQASKGVSSHIRRLRAQWSVPPNATAGAPSSCGYVLRGYVRNGTHRVRLAQTSAPLGPDVTADVSS